MPGTQHSEPRKTERIPGSYMSIAISTNLSHKLFFPVTQSSLILLRNTSFLAPLCDVATTYLQPRESCADTPKTCTSSLLRMLRAAAPLAQQGLGTYSLQALCFEVHTGGLQVCIVSLPNPWPSRPSECDLIWKHACC